MEYLKEQRKKRIMIAVIAGAVLLYICFSVVTYFSIIKPLVDDKVDEITGNDGTTDGNDSFIDALKITYNYTVDEDKKTCTITGIAKNTTRKNISLPAEIDGYTVTGIGENAFAESKLESVIIPASVKSIGKGAFSKCESLIAVYGLEECDDLKQILDNTFYQCTSLSVIKLPPNLVYIGKKAFLECLSLKSIDLPSKLVTIDEYGFFGCSSLLSITFPASIKKMGFAAFAMCISLEEVVVPSSIKDYNNGMFAGCESLKNIYAADDNMYAISIDGILYNKSQYVDSQTVLWCYPSGKTEKEFKIPNSVVVLPDYSFSYNNNLEILYIPKSVTAIYPCTISRSPNLETIVYGGTVEEWLSITIYPEWDLESSNYTIYCTDGQISKDGTITYK